MNQTPKLMARCPHMIPAERCIVVMLPSMSARESVVEATGDGVVPSHFDRLEDHGVDEIECGWKGELEVVLHESRYECWAEGDCPACGQPILIKGTD